MKQVMVKYLPQEVLPGDLIAGGRFNVQTSTCLDEDQAKAYLAAIEGENSLRQAVFDFHNHGYGNAGCTSGHLIPDYPRVLEEGFSGIHKALQGHYNALSKEEKQGSKGAQLGAMLTAACIPGELAGKYSDLCLNLAATETAPARQAELKIMAENLSAVAWEPPQTFWQAVQALWLTHMLVIADENYPGILIRALRGRMLIMGPARLPWTRSAVNKGIYPAGIG